MSHFLLSLSPIFICIIVIFIFKKSVIISALIAILYTIILASVNSLYSMSYMHSLNALAASFILTLTVALVIIPGLYFNNILVKIGNLENIVTLIEKLPFKNDQKTLILILGTLPAIESFTGFGISLLIGIPIFFRLFETKTAFYLAMLSLNIIPWGTLAVSTIISSNLTGYNIHAIGKETALVSFFIFPLIGLISLYVINGISLLKEKWHLAITHGFLFSFLLLVFNHFKLTEIAGVLAGICTSIITFLFYYNFSPYKNAINKIILNLLRTLLPYFLLLMFILILRIPNLNNFLQNLYKIQWQNISLSPLISPGMAILLVSVIFLSFNKIKLDHKILGSKIKVALSSLFLFILLARLMYEFHFIKNISETLITWNGKFLMVLLAPLIGMGSGFITGSNVGGNALAMNLQQKIGESLEHGLLFAAVQNSAAGHIIFTSLPIIILIITISKDFTAKNFNLDKNILTKDLLNFGLKISLLIYISLLITTITLFYLNIS